MSKKVNLTPRELELLRKNTKGAEPIEVVRSKTPVDTGKWLTHSPLWICIFKDQVVLLSVGRRKYVESIPLTEASLTHYCHTSGELVLAPVRNITHRRLAMSPGDSLRVFDALGINASNLSNHS